MLRGDTRDGGLAVTWASVVLLLVFACWVRIQGLPSLFFTMDASHPISRAVDILQGGALPWRGEAVCFHFGALQTWIFVPILALSRRMEDAMVLNAVFHALGVVPMALAGRQVGGRMTAVLAAAVYACWPLLVLHPCRGAWTYHAPLFLACAVMAAALALEGRSRVHVVIMAVAMACAIHFHPYALAPVAAAVVLVPRLAKLHGWKILVVGAIAGAAILAPMVVDNAQTMFGDRPNEGCSLVPPTPGPLLGLLLQSVLRVGIGWPVWAEVLVLAALPCGAAVLVARRAPLDPGGLVVMWALLSYAVVAIMAKVLSYMAAYHAAVLVPVHALALAWLATRLFEASGDQRLARWAGRVVPLLMAALLGLGAIRASSDALVDPRPGTGSMAVVTQVVEAIHHHRGSSATSVVLVSDGAVVSMGEVLIYNADLWLRGDRVPPPPPDERFASPAYAVVTLRDEAWEAWGGTDERLLTLTPREGTTLAVLAYADHKEALAGVRRLCGLLDTWPELEISDLSRSLEGLALAEDYVGGPASSQVEILCRGGRSGAGLGE
jgi:hypothetical protein